jgi:ElaB/YqjD/DUF883 family membrane-anchored ribosome-binding protein
MNASANDTIDTLHQSSNEAKSDFRRRGAKVRDYANDELRSFLGDVEELVKRVGNITDDDVARVRGRVASALEDAQGLAEESSDSLRERARVLAAQARERARAVAGQANDYVRERPWTAIGLAAAVGLLVGVGVSVVSSRR